MTDHVRQAELELKAREASLGRSLRLYRRATDRGRDSETPGGLSILKKNIAPLAHAIAEWMVAEEARGLSLYHQPALFRLCGNMDPAALAYIALRVALDSAAKQKLRSTTAYAIGRAIEDEARAEAHEAADPTLHAHIMKVWRRRGASPDAGRAHLVYSSVRDDIPLPTWTRAERLGVGGSMLMFIYDVVGVVTEELRASSSSRHANVHVILAPGVRVDGGLHDYIASAEDAALEFALLSGVSPAFQYPNAAPMGKVQFLLLPYWVWWASHRADG